MTSVEIEGEETGSLYEAPRRKVTMKNEKVKHIELGSGIETEDGRSVECKQLLKEPCPSTAYEVHEE